MDGHFNGAWMTMMRLGSFKFGVYTAAYQSLDRSTEYKWGEQPLFMNYDDLQYLGPGADTITLQGIVFPEYKGGTGQIDKLRALGARGEPHLLVSGFGSIMGRWIIQQVTEGQTIFAAGGIPRRQEFTVSLRRYDDTGDKLSLLQKIGNAIGGLNDFAI